MLSRFFKKDKLASADAEVRLQAVADVEDQSTLSALASNDPAAKVRLAAIDKLTDKSGLIELLNDESTAAGAAKRLAVLMELPSDAQLLTHANVLSSYLDAHRDTSVVEIASYLSEPEHLIELCIKVRGDEREQLLQHDSLRTEAALALIEKLSRNKDKSCNRYARLTLERVRRAKSSVQDALERIEEIDSALRRLSSDGANLSSRLNKLTSNRTQAIAAFEAATEELTGTLSDYQKEQVPIAPIVEAPLESPTNISSDAPLLLGFKATLDGADALDIVTRWREVAQSLSFDDLSTEHRSLFTQLDETVARIRAAADKVSNYKPPSLEPIEDCTELGRALRTRKDWLKSWHKLENGLAWPASVKSLDKLNQLQQQATNVENEVAIIEQRISNATSELELSFQQLENALEDNQYKAGVQSIKQVRSLLKNVPGSGKKQEYERKLTTLSARLNELKDWQKFATLPKRQELIRELRLLADQPKEAPTQAAELKHLRSQWQNLGPATSTDERKLQDEFDQLAETAYAPCAAYYAEQDKQRAQNLTTRIELCDQLEAYLEETDWPNADYKAAEQIMRTAREEWRKHHPCERKALKPVEQRFEVLQNKLFETIKAQWDKNISLKEAIVARAEALLESADSAAQAEGAKALQMEWKTVGPVPRAVDQRLWRSFRKTCDQIFDARKAEFKAVREEQDQQIAQLRDALAELADIVSAQELAPSQYQSQNQAIDELLSDFRAPNDLLKSLEATRKAYRERRKRLAEDARVEEINQILMWDVELTKAESKGESVDAPHQFFKARRISDEEVQRILLELEIVADQPSPQSDQAARMALQVELMNQGMRTTSKADPMTYLERWCALTKPDDENLHTRFEKALRAIALP